MLLVQKQKNSLFTETYPTSVNQIAQPHITSETPSEYVCSQTWLRRKGKKKMTRQKIYLIFFDKKCYTMCATTPGDWPSENLCCCKSATVRRVSFIRRPKIAWTKNAKYFDKSSWHSRTEKIDQVKPFRKKSRVCWKKV